MAVERAVVTGGAGFVGSSVVEALAGRGTSVLVVDDLSTGAASNLDRLAGTVELLKHDIRDAGPLRAAFTAFRPDLVFHLAARTDVRASMSDPQDDASVNVLGSINVFGAAAAVGVQRVVNTSTGGAIYAPGSPIPTPETAQVAPLSAYGLSKRVVEESSPPWPTRRMPLQVGCAAGATLPILGWTRWVSGRAIRRAGFEPRPRRPQLGRLRAAPQQCPAPL